MELFENAVVIGLVIVCILLFILGIYFAHESDKFEKQSKIDTGIISRDIIRLANQQNTIENLQKQVECDQGIIEKGITRCTNQGIKIENLKLKQEKRKELKRSFEAAIEELTTERGLLTLAYDKMNTLTDKNIENRKAIESLAEQISNLIRSRGLLFEENNELKNSRDYYKAKANHEKLPVE